MPCYDTTYKLHLYKAIRDTHILRKGQKCWEIYGTGALAAKVATKWKGRGRWLRYWVHVAEEGSGKGFNNVPNVKYVGEVEVTKPFYDMIDRF